MVEQPYQSRLDEGMIRAYLTHNRVVGFTHQYPRGLLPADADTHPATKLFEPAGEPSYRDLRTRLESEWVPELQRILEIDACSLSVIWDADFLTGQKTLRALTPSCSARSMLVRRSRSLSSRCRLSCRRRSAAYASTKAASARVAPSARALPATQPHRSDARRRNCEQPTRSHGQPRERNRHPRTDRIAPGGLCRRRPARLGQSSRAVTPAHTGMRLVRDALSTRAVTYRRPFGRALLGGGKLVPPRGSASSKLRTGSRSGDRALALLARKILVRADDEGCLPVLLREITGLPRPDCRRTRRADDVGDRCSQHRTVARRAGAARSACDLTPFAPAITSKTTPRSAAISKATGRRLEASSGARGNGELPGGYDTVQPSVDDGTL